MNLRYIRHIACLAIVCTFLIGSADHTTWELRSALAATNADDQGQAEEGGLLAGAYVPTNQRIAYTQVSGWKQLVHYPNARFIKVHFAEFNLLPGDVLTVSDSSGAEVYTYHADPTKVKVAGDSGHTTGPEGGFWAMSVMGDTAVVQLRSTNRQRTQLDHTTLAQFRVVIDRYTRGFSDAELDVSISSICGTNQRKDAICYKTSHPTEWNKSAATAILAYHNGTRWCTAWRVGQKNHVISNNHCIDSQADVDSMETWFNYCRTACGGGTIGPTVKVDNDRLILANGNLDLALITINTSPSVAEFGYYELETRVPALSDPIYIPQHGGTNPRELAIESDQNAGNICRVDQITSSEIGYKCDTIGGSSGSAVLSRATHKVVALHHTGSCPSGVNHGVRADLIWPVIRPYVGDPVPTPITVTPPTVTPSTITPTPPTITPTPPTGTLFSDSFETNKGWTTNPNGSDTATLGKWERGVPEPTDYQGPKQIAAASPSNDLVTGRLAGSGVGDHDLDGGTTSIRSPSIALPSGSNPTLSFKYYLAHSNNSSNEDSLRVKIVGSSGTSTLFEKLGAASNLDAAWASTTLSLTSYAGQTVSILIEAADNGTGSLLEAAIDDLVVNGNTTITPTPPTTTPTPGFTDTFETDKGWTTNPNGTDTATAGRWERGVPEPTDYNGPKQIAAASPSNDLVTGRLAGAASGDHDLDGGTTSIRSPSITLPSSGNLMLSFKYYLAHASNADSTDYLRVKIVGSSGTSTVFEKLGAAADIDAVWATATINLNAYAGQTVSILIEATDADTGSLVEAAVDDVTIQTN